jgi:transcriptional regulator with XRE-family HTH domain
MSFSDQIRAAIRKSGLSRYRLAREAGVDQASLSRFLAGAGVTTTTLDAIAGVLRLEVTMKGPRKSLLAKHGR